MISFLFQPIVRAAAIGLFGTLIFANSAFPADVLKGAGLQRQLAGGTHGKTTKVVPAAGAKARQAGGSQPNSPEANETIVLTTGSQLPGASRKRLQITDGAQNVQALDRKQLERSGATSVTEAVRRLVP
jgi:hypothetical protein